MRGEFFRSNNNRSSWQARVGDLVQSLSTSDWPPSKQIGIVTNIEYDGLPHGTKIARITVTYAKCGKSFDYSWEYYKQLKLIKHAPKGL